ncbi:hypothetical protein MNBD_ACTINO02-1428 [hydrothermal vent metagenome]|uniref:Lipoprotein n=1 Tax=hydrothermal vent metagenome TaxID=652676 RepID=A0A3B0T3S1_9ZZZZ
MTTVVRLKWMLVAVAMIAAACGGGGATPSVDSTDPAAPTKGNVVSPDGMLTVVPPAGAGDITIAEAGPIVEFEDFGQSLRSYELGPDGSTFDTPVELRFQVNADELARGVLVAARSSDGSVEPLDFTIESSGGPVVVATIDHFTVVELRWDFYRDITVKAPASENVDSFVLAGLQVGFTAEQVAAGYSGPELFEISEGIEGAWSASGSISGSSRESLFCASAGPGVVTYSGRAIIEYVGRSSGASALGPAVRGSSWTVQGPVQDANANVECVQAAEVPPEDVKCRDTTMGDDAGLDECTVTDSVWVSVAEGDATIAVLTDEPLQPGPKGKMVLSLFGLTPEGELVAIECGAEQDCVGFFGAGFVNFTALFPIVSSVAEAVWRFSRVPLTVEGINIVLEVPVGETVTGDPVGGPAVLTEATLYISNGEFESITRLSLDAIREALSK